jgi:hypothetical protein
VLLQAGYDPAEELPGTDMHGWGALVIHLPYYSLCGLLTVFVLKKVLIATVMFFSQSGRISFGIR